MKTRLIAIGLLAVAGFAYAGLESATYINQLVATNPTGSDHYATADDHIRVVKGALLNSFPQISGPVTSTHTELSLLSGKSGTVWTSANDGVASGLDADLLDGSSSAAFATASHVHSAADVTSGTLGVARGGTGTTSATGSGNLVLSASPQLTGTATAATFNATTLQQGGSGVWTAANDGAGGGLDADLLDGVSSAGFCQTGGTGCPTAGIQRHAYGSVTDSGGACTTSGLPTSGFGAVSYGGSAGLCNLTINAGYASTPICTASAIPGTTARFATVSCTSTTACSIQMYNVSGTGVVGAVTFSCVGT